ncbi:hypothetical protein L207DRAFT_582358 [Hyaloscypha variabilis F]|uniref:Bromodomain associated domain-containing protein n=1 Tax=Hyaloscypha variabilis (strain UAMH 11265 / GT02V1 / F) TaxID=1149755 RepID=A0A2J6RTU7_HYAVF|nr:hypothetical protein L207DRAFT_582358 [Hyaloscypha variabilis F]
MTTPHALHHSLLRPCILQILRAAGYHSTRPSVLDTLTDLAARYMLLLAQTTAKHAAINHNEPELSLEISIQDVRMAMQDCGVLIPEKTLEEQDYEGKEDTRGVDAFISWAMGKGNSEIRRVALEGSDGAKEDYLTVLKKKHTTSDEDTRYVGTMLGKPAEPRIIKVEGSEITSLKEWAERLKNPPNPASTMPSSRRQSSALSSLGDVTVEEMEF